MSVSYLRHRKTPFLLMGDPWDVRTRCSALPVGALPGIWRIEDIDIPNADSFLRLRVDSSSDEQGVPAIPVFHGGGWVIGDLMWTEGQCRQLLGEDAMSRHLGGVPTGSRGPVPGRGQRMPTLRSNGSLRIPRLQMTRSESLPTGRVQVETWWRLLR